MFSPKSPLTPTPFLPKNIIHSESKLVGGYKESVGQLLVQNGELSQSPPEFPDRWSTRVAAWRVRASPRRRGSSEIK